MTQSTVFKPGQQWMRLLSSGSLDEFSRAFSPGAELESSILPFRLQGPLAIRAFFFTFGEVCESLQFTAEYGGNDRTCLEWEAVGFEERIFSGSTLLHRAEDGRIGCVRLNVAPFRMVLRLSSAMTQRLAVLLDEKGV